MDPEENISITMSEYNSLLRSRAMLIALENAGVDNWEGYSIAMEELSEDEDEEN